MSDELPMVPNCNTIAYFGQDSDRKEKADTANSILSEYELLEI